VVCWQVKLCDPHLSALEVRFSRRCAIQIYVYLYYLYLYLCISVFSSYSYIFVPVASVYASSLSAQKSRRRPSVAHNTGISQK